MMLRKYQADTIQEAVARVKSELGPDAMIVSTRQVRRGLIGSAYEVTASIEPPDLEPPLEPRAAPRATPAASAPGEADLERWVAPLRAELRSLKARLPEADRGMNQQILRELGALRGAVAQLSARGPRPSLEELAELQVAEPSRERVLALVGPTGAGKTTTVAKLAARAALGRRKMVALVSVDTYRVGGEEQIRIFADLIGAPLILVRRLEGLAAAIDDLAGYAHVYIDSAGRSPKDTGAIAELSSALQEIAEAEVHLTMPVATHPRLIDAWVERWQPARLARLLFTKLDEAEDLEELLRAPARHQLPVSFVTVGQRVPEDIEEVDRGRLLQLASYGLESWESAA